MIFRGKSKRELLDNAVSIARRIVSGDIDPNEGCDLIGQINAELGWPDELTGFGALAHDQHGHEHLGVYAKDCVSEIIEESKELIEKIG